jgi:hypothetical protein
MRNAEERGRPEGLLASFCTYKHLGLLKCQEMLNNFAPAMPANTYRANPRERALRRHERSRPAHVQRNPRVKRQEQNKVVKRWLAAVLLLPLGAITALTLGEMLWRALTRLAFWKTDEFVFFTLGGAAWAAAWWGGFRPVRSYVFGHEMSHLVVARLFGGKIIDWNVSAQGGFVETNKSNTWISLAPYLLPFYSLIVLGVFGVAGILWHLHHPCEVTLGSTQIEFKPVWLFYVSLGFTWCFHATYTYKTVLAQQSDLERNGEFFSLLLIFLINVLLLVGLFLAASPAPGFGAAEVGRCWMGTAEWLGRLLFVW